MWSSATFEAVTEWRYDHQLTTQLMKKGWGGVGWGGVSWEGVGCRGVGWGGVT